MKKQNMRHPRKYLAYYVSGHDRCIVEFYSEHRANSKANFADAKDELVSKYGKHARSYEIISTTLVEGE